MKSLIGEILNPIQDFWKMRRKMKNEQVFFGVIPAVAGVMLFGCLMFFNVKRPVSIDGFALDLLNQLITVLALFISFSMAYLSIIITSSSDSINKLKGDFSEYYILDGKKCTLFQVLVADITYTLIIETLFLLFVFFQKFLCYMCANIGLKVLISVDVSVTVHILFLIMITVKNIYFSFWNSKTS